MLAADERRAEILRALRQQDTVRVSRLAQRFGVSEVTIRTDLRFLSTAGLLKRLHGGARTSHTPPPEPNLTEKRRLHRDRKMQISACARKLVAPNETLILDAGSTTLQLARLLHDIGPLHVFTNSLPIAGELAHAPEVELLVSGGTLRLPSQSLQGPNAEASLERFRFDKLFLGVDGLAPDFGLSTYDEAEARLNSRMIAQSRRVIVLADSSKFGCCCLHQIARLEQVHTVISDAALARPMREALIARGVELIITGDEKNES